MILKVQWIKEKNFRSDSECFLDEISDLLSKFCIDASFHFPFVVTYILFCYDGLLQHEWLDEHAK